MKRTNLILCAILLITCLFAGLFLLRRLHFSISYAPYVPQNLAEEIYLSRRDPSFRPLWWAVMRDAPFNTISNLVLSTPGIIEKEEAQNEIQCALTEAARKKRGDVVAFLLNNGADPKPYIDFVEELAMDNTVSASLFVAASNDVAFIKKTREILEHNR